MLVAQHAFANIQHLGITSILQQSTGMFGTYATCANQGDGLRFVTAGQFCDTGQKFRCTPAELNRRAFGALGNACIPSFIRAANVNDCNLSGPGHGQGIARRYDLLGPNTRSTYCYE